MSFLDRRHLRSVDRALASNDDQGLQNGRITTAPRNKRSADRNKNVRAVCEHRSRLGNVAAAQIFEDDRQVIRQLPRQEVESRPLVNALEIDHCLASVAAFAVEM